MLSRKLQSSGTPQIEFVGSVSSTVSNTDLSISLASVSFEAGDLALLYIAGSTRDDSYYLDGWALVERNTTVTRESAVYMRVLGDNTDTAASTSLAAGSTHGIISVFRNATINGDEVAMDIGGGSSTFAPDPPTAAVSDVEANDVVFVCGMHESSTSNITGGPSGGGYTSIYTGKSSSSTTAGVSYRTGLTGQPNPATLEGDGSWVNRDWVAHTIILRPRSTPYTTGLIGGVSTFEEAASSTISVDVSSLGIEGGDLLMIYYTAYSTTCDVSGATVWQDLAYTASYPNTHVRPGFLLGNESTITITGTTSPKNLHAVVIRGYDYHYPIGNRTAATGSSTVPDPPAESGVVSSDIVLVWGTINQDDTALTAPTNFTLITEETTSPTTFGVTSAVAWRTSTSGSINPPAFGGGTGESKTWTSATHILDKR